MKIPGRIFVLAVAFSICCPIAAQLRIIPQEKRDSILAPRLSVDSASLSFDTRHIEAEIEIGGRSPVTFTYNLTNVGDADLHIRRLSTTCSCVSAVCSRQIIEPGESAPITVLYDTKGLPGRFERSIFVYTMEGNAPAAILRLTVNLTGDAPLSELYPVEMGIIRLRRKEVSFDEGVRAVETIRFINLSGSPMNLKCDPFFLPDCIGFSTRPETVQDGSEGEIVIEYDPSKGGEKKNMPVILKGLGLPPGRSTILVGINP